MSTTRTVGVTDPGPPTVAGALGWTTDAPELPPSQPSLANYAVLESTQLFHVPGHVAWLRVMANEKSAERLRALDIVAASWPDLSVGLARQLLYGEITVNNTSVIVYLTDKNITFRKGK